jgi:UDP-N-acetylmuramoyl-tripeptide--D-alanyl-D-alanine ligase
MSMTTLWQGSEIAKACGGVLKKPFAVEGVSIDSRTVKKGDLFVALKGECFDGHDYVKDVLAAGAAGALVSAVPSGVSADAPLVVAKDAQQALEALGKAARARSHAKFVAVTGSVGKTSTKEMLHVMLQDQGKTHATVGNLNNHIGLPLSLARMPQDTAYGVFELGMNHAGEISVLTNTLRPHVAVITTVEAVHIEFFDSVAGIARAKAEIMEGLEKDGIAVLPIDNPHFGLLKAEAEKNKVARIMTFGVSKDADFRLVDYRPTREGSQVVAQCDGVEIRYETGMLGKHQAVNSLAALAAVKAMGGDVKRAAESLKKASPAKGRGRLMQVKIGGKKITLLDDSYNASPASMRAGMAVLAELASALKARPVAALGDMRELGENSQKFHEGLAEAVVGNGIKQVFTAGQWMQYLHNALPTEKKAGHVDEPLKLIPLLENDLKENDVLLVKGSNGSLMWKLVEAVASNKVGA